MLINVSRREKVAPVKNQICDASHAPRSRFVSVSPDLWISSAQLQHENKSLPGHLNYNIG